MEPLCHHWADQTNLGNDLSHDGQTVNPCNGTGDPLLFCCWAFWWWWLLSQNQCLKKEKMCLQKLQSLQLFSHINLKWRVWIQLANSSDGFGNFPDYWVGTSASLWMCLRRPSQFLDQTMSSKQLMMTTSTRIKLSRCGKMFLKCWVGLYWLWVWDARSQPTDISSCQVPSTDPLCTLHVNTNPLCTLYLNTSPLCTFHFPPAHCVTYIWTSWTTDLTTP